VSHSSGKPTNRVVTGAVEKNPFQFSIAENSLQFAVSNERDEHCEQEQC
jgi:hypothetical protein